MRARLLLPLLLGLALSGVSALPARAAELVMYELANCPWCLLFHREIGSAYGRSPEGKRAPLRIVDIKAPPADIQLAAPVRSSPTFVLVEAGREVGRITGYPGADFFWDMLTEQLAKLEPLPLPPPAETAGPRVEQRSL